MLDRLCPKHFHLPTLGPILKYLSHEIASGRGFFVLRGLEPETYSKLRNIVIYAGIGSYIGNRFGRQDEYGNMLC